MPEPLYTATNCHGAYQLNWMLSVFWKEPIASDGWLDSLKQATEPDGVRILEHRFSEPSVSQFFLSTKPEVAPRQFVRSVKGRLQYLVRDKRPKAFRRNYGFRSVGSVKRDVVERYVADQLGYMNNVAYVLGMKPVFQFGFYVGTFGEYDRGVVSAPRR